MAKLKMGAEKKDVQKPADDVVVMPMFVPARIKPGEEMMNVTTRQQFVTDGIFTWLEWHYSRVLGILFAVAALFLISINLWLAAGAGALAGYWYSTHVRTARKINIFYTTRRLLYTR